MLIKKKRVSKSPCKCKPKLKIENDSLFLKFQTKIENGNSDFFSNLNLQGFQIKIEKLKGHFRTRTFTFTTNINFQNTPGIIQNKIRFKFQILIFKFKNKIELHSSILKFQILIENWK